MVWLVTLVEVICFYDSHCGILLNFLSNSTVVCFFENMTIILLNWWADCSFSPFFPKFHLSSVFFIQNSWSNYCLLQIHSPKAGTPPTRDFLFSLVPGFSESIPGYFDPRVDHETFNHWSWDLTLWPWRSSLTWSSFDTLFFIDSK